MNSVGHFDVGSTHLRHLPYFEHQTPTGLDIAYLRLGDTVLELTGRGEPRLNGFHFCLETDDFASAVATLKAAGVEIATEPHKTAARTPREANWMRVVFKGPDGESIEIRG